LLAVTSALQVCVTTFGGFEVEVVGPVTYVALFVDTILKTRCLPFLQVGVTTFGGFDVEVVDPIADYLATLKEVFDFGMLKAFVTRSDFSMVFDAMHAVTGEAHTCP
jgi:phosphoglucomutase